MAADKSRCNSICGNNADRLFDSNNNNVSDVCSDKITLQTTLNDLNDDCLLEIFEMVEAIDWIRLSKASSRFRSIISTQILSRRPINFGTISRNHSIRKVFRMFGSFASSIKISTLDIQYQHERRSSAEELFHLLAKHCNAEKLRDLSLSADFSELRAEYVNELGLRLANLENISIYSMRKWIRTAMENDGESDFMNRLLCHAKKIETIELINMPLNGDLLCHNQLDALKRISVFNCTAIDFCSFYKLMQRIGNQIKTFEWKNSTFKAKSNFCQTILDVCDVIGDCMPNLNALMFEMNYGQNYCQERATRE